MAVKTVDINSFETEVINAGVPVLADFYADWCGPCKMLRPTLDAIAAERTDVKVVAVNIDENPDLADEFDISSSCLRTVPRRTEASDSSPRK